MTGSILNTAVTRLNYLGDVQDMLAANIANADTPNYQPLTAVSFSDFMSGADGGVAMLRNNAADLPGLADTPMAANPFTAVQEHAPDGNAVELDKQMVAMSKNQTDQQLTTELYQSYMGMYKTALGTTG